jgi:pyruvate dehydrogenase E2 component (dihydrolipoamide acetyltransferase)
VAITITVPRLGWSMDEGTFAGWLKQEGDLIRPGDALFVLESDKAAEEIESLDTGLLRIPSDAPQAGDKVAVGQVLAYLVTAGEVVPASVRGREPEINPPAVGVREEMAPTAMLTPAPSTMASGAQPASSPRARRVATEMGIDWKALKGSGRDGRVRERDVRAAAGTPSGGRLIPHTKMRRAIAARAVAGVTQSAPVTLMRKVHATSLVNFRNQIRESTGPGEVVPSYTDLMVKLTALALREHPLLRAQWHDDALFIPDRIDIAFAVDTEAGLFAPVLRAVDQLTLQQVAVQSHDLAALARAGRLTGEQMRDSTFTVTNLGGFGIDAFTPILQLPQCAVLGVGRIVREPIVLDNQVLPGDTMTLSLTFDHRVLDGAPAARFLDVLRDCIEQPGQWLNAQA